MRALFLIAKSTRFDKRKRTRFRACGYGHDPPPPSKAPALTQQERSCVFEHDELGHLFPELTSYQRPQITQAIARVEP